MARPPKKKSTTTDADQSTTDYRHDDKRTNIPPAQIASEGKAPRVKKAKYHYSPHLPPELRFDPTTKADKVLALADFAAQRALSADELKLLREALKAQEPWLEWATKQEQHDQKFFEVDPVVLHIHERVSAQAIVKIAARQDVQRDLFADPKQPYQQAVQFYRHDMDWANRLILGDSLQVMSSLAKRENLGGKIQMIFMDPPYGIRFASNFQPEVGQRDVSDKEKDLSREVEMVRAFRDTWHLGVHSYLAYLRDRLMAAKSLLTDSGSIFLQISDENLHRVRLLMDEVFGPENFAGLIVVQKTGGLGSSGLKSVADYLLWYYRDATRAQYFQVYHVKRVGEGATTGARYDQLEDTESGARRSMNTQERESPGTIGDHLRAFQLDNLTSGAFRENTTVNYSFQGATFHPGQNACWKTTVAGLDRLRLAERIERAGKTLRFVRFLDDFPAYEITNIWNDVAGSPDKVYVVQTSPAVVARCMLMTTKPGDLVLDPTCGSGTTAFVAETWGRRWITIDTSRVAIAVARQRLLTSKYDHFRTSGSTPASGFTYKKVPHVTLGSIAQNPNLDSVFAEHERVLDNALIAANKALAGVKDELRRKLASKLAEKLKVEGKRAITDADERRWSLPKGRFEHWTMPFDTDPDWPKVLQDAVTAYRRAWRAKMDAVNACIAASAESEDLVDQPEVVKNVLRVSGPFTVEGVNPEEFSLGEEGLFDGTPNEFEASTDAGPTDDRIDNLAAYLTEMVRLLKADGLTFTGAKTPKKLARVDPLFSQGTGTELHAEGIWEGVSDDEANNIAITFGPQYGPVTAMQVENAIRAARRYDELVIAGFSFAPEATAAIEDSRHPKLRIHQAQIRPDINPGMAGLLKDTPNSQLFTVFGQPEIDLKETRDGWVVTLEGVDLYDPVNNVVRSSKADKVAAWFLDSDFDGRCFCVTQAFFPNQKAWEKIAKALKSQADASIFEKLAGTVSLPFPAGTHKRIAVKVIDPRGNEVMAIRKLGK